MIEERATAESRSKCQQDLIPRMKRELRDDDSFSTLSEHYFS